MQYSYSIFTYSGESAYATRPFIYNLYNPNYNPNLEHPNIRIGMHYVKQLLSCL